MKKIVILLLLILFSGSAIAKCSKKLDREFVFTFNHPPYDVDKLEKIYESCPKYPVEMLLYIAKGDRYEASGEMEYAHTEYKKSLNAYSEIIMSKTRAYRDLANYLESQIKKYAPTTAKEITRGTVKQTRNRGGKMVTEYRIEDLPVNFQSNSNKVSKKGVNKEQVKAIYKALSNKRYKGKVVKITGFTDTSGSALHNQGLSERRAEALKNYLKKRGLENYISSQGVGESQPICTQGVIVPKKNYEYKCSRKENKYRSRRVTIMIRGE